MACVARLGPGFVADACTALSGSWGPAGVGSSSFIVDQRPSQARDWNPETREGGRLEGLSWPRRGKRSVFSSLQPKNLDARLERVQQPIFRHAKLRVAIALYKAVDGA